MTYHCRNASGAMTLGCCCTRGLKGVHGDGNDDGEGGSVWMEVKGVSWNRTAFTEFILYALYDTVGKAHAFSINVYERRG